MRNLAWAVAFRSENLLIAADHFASDLQLSVGCKEEASLLDSLNPANTEPRDCSVHVQQVHAQNEAGMPVVVQQRSHSTSLKEGRTLVVFLARRALVNGRFTGCGRPTWSAACVQVQASESQNAVSKGSRQHASKGVGLENSRYGHALA